MSERTLQMAEMLEMLPENDQNLAFEIIRKLVLAWDPDYTRLTPSEAAELKEAEASGYIDENELDWNNLDKYE